MATILEAGAGGETVVSEHSGRSVTSAPGDTPRDHGGQPVPFANRSEAFQAIVAHEDEDYAEERAGLGIATEEDKRAEEENLREYEAFKASKAASDAKATKGDTSAS